MFKKIKDLFLNNAIALFVIYYFLIFIDTTTLEIDYPILEKIISISKTIINVLFLLRLFFLLPQYKERIFGTKINKKNKLVVFFYIIIIIMGIGLIANFIVTKNKRLLFLMLILLSMFDTDYKKTIKATMSCQIILTSILVLLCVFGLTQNYVVDRVGRADLGRNSLGFLYTTNLAQMVLFPAILYIYMVGTKIKWHELFAIQLLNAFTYFITDSRAEMIILELAIIVMIISKILVKIKKMNILERIKKLYSGFFTSTFIIYPIISLVIVLLYPLGGIITDINDALSNRLGQTYENVAEYGFKPFGEKIEFRGNGLKQKLKNENLKSNYVDNEYIQLMFSHGYVFMICFIVSLNILLIMLHNGKKYKEVILCSIYLLFGLINPRIVSLLYCPILLMIIPTLKDYKRVSIEQE